VQFWSTTVVRNVVSGLSSRTSRTTTEQPGRHAALDDETTEPRTRGRRLVVVQRVAIAGQLGEELDVPLPHDARTPADVAHTRRHRPTVAQTARSGALPNGALNARHQITTVRPASAARRGSSYCWSPRLPFSAPRSIDPEAPPSEVSPGTRRTRRSGPADVAKLVRVRTAGRRRAARPLPCRSSRARASGTARRRAARSWARPTRRPARLRPVLPPSRRARRPRGPAAS
jgi:hypothetical protein